MNKEKAIFEMLNGKKVRRKIWDNGDYAYYCPIQGLFYIYLSNDDVTKELMINAYGNEDWELYKEPKKKIDLYLWAIKYKDNIYYVLYHLYFPNKETLIKELPFEINDAIRLDYTKITVEEEEG